MGEQDKKKADDVMAAWSRGLNLSMYEGAEELSTRFAAVLSEARAETWERAIEVVKGVRDERLVRASQSGSDREWDEAVAALDGDVKPSDVIAALEAARDGGK